MRISALKSQRRSKKRLSVFVDGEYAFSLDRETVAQFRLKAGTRVDPKLLEQIVLEEQFRHCRDDAFRLLSYRARSEKELRERLDKKGYSPEIVEKVLARLRELGIVDDEKLARDYVEARITVGHKGKFRVKQELLKKGIAPETVRTALQTAPSELAAARMVLEHHLPRYRRLDPQTRLRRLYGLLARRGFSADTIEQVLRQYRQGTSQNLLT
ncbi:MAG: RecX family transcriptional regulator [candidate division WOR-3 bacterium]